VATKFSAHLETSFIKSVAMKSAYASLALSAIMLAPKCAMAEPQSVDISPENGRRDHLSANRSNWMVTSGEPAMFKLDGIEYRIDPLDGSGAAIQADWWKAGLVHDALMASDGVYFEGRNAGLRLTIRGLSAGKHSLATFHNSLWDKPMPNVDVVVAGATVAKTIEPTHRVTNDADAAIAFLEFDAKEGKDVVVEFRQHASADDGLPKRVVLNGFELDTANPTWKAAKPNPHSGDEHVAVKPTLTWRPAKSAIGHDVFLGTSADAVAKATRSSAEYRGRVMEPKLATEAANSFGTYFWRVDEIHSEAPDDVTKGDVWMFRVRHLAFPGAEGYGRFARGGRAGRVWKVTNLNDSGPGSLRAAIEANEPRTIVFDVSGRIALQNRLGIRNPYLTIAGQTAPGKGICIANLNLGMLGTHDVIVRYIRVRPGDTAGLTLDGMGMASTDHAIIDHCSISWTQDEAFSSRGAKNITLQRTLISEALNVAGHKKYEKGKQHGYAASIGGDIGSFHHNLLAHCAGRNWSLAGGLDKAGRHTARLDIRNNVVYNWSHRTTDGGAMQVNFVNNYYKPGPASRVFHVLMPERHLVQAFGPQEYFVSGNVMEGRYGADERLAGVIAPRNGGSIDEFLVDDPFFDHHVTTQSAADAYEDVLADVGCNVPTLDDHDRRIIQETRDGSAKYKGGITGYPGLPDSQQDVGGWEEYPEVHRPADWDTDDDGMPNDWETLHGFNPSDANDGQQDADGDGYTNLEAYLNSIVAAASEARTTRQQ
jgi:hypothetical protein